MKRFRYIVFAVLVTAIVFLLAGCGGKTGGSVASTGTDSAIQQNAQEIQKMLTGIESDASHITTEDETPDSADSTIDQINSALNGSQDDISGLNE